MKKLFLLMPVLACVLAFVACGDDDGFGKYDSYPPTWKGFELSSNPVHPGDSLRVTALQDMKGHLINATTYVWTMKCKVLNPSGEISDYSLSDDVHTNYDGISNADPTYKFKIPDNAVAGTGTVSFEAKYNYSGNGIQVQDGSTYNQGTTGKGHISSLSGSMSGGAKGNVTFTIVQ